MPEWHQLVPMSNMSESETELKKNKKQTKKKHGFHNGESGELCFYPSLTEP